MIQIIPYQPTWSEEFEEIGGSLRLSLGDLALRIDHIGSTAVPNLAAKDIIDIQVTVAALETAVAQAFTHFGYQQMGDIRTDHLPPGSSGEAEDWIKWFFKPPVDQRPAHIHVRVQGRANQRYPLLFRDYLRGHPQTAAAYAELKRRLAAHLADPAMYPEVKDPAVDLIYFAAEEWATAVGWQPGPSDC